MPKFIDLTGQRFGRWIVQRKCDNYRKGSVTYVCICDCGTERNVIGSSLRGGLSISCGCQTRDGRSKLPEYQIWCGILSRSFNPDRKSFAEYGARGIVACDRWKVSFENFLADMGHRPSSEHSIDRLNCDLGYNKENCRWATPVEQATNKKRTRFVVYRGERMALTDAVRASGAVIHYETVWARIQIGWSIDRALETAPTGRRRSFIPETA